MVFIFIGVEKKTQNPQHVRRTLRLEIQGRIMAKKEKSGFNMSYNLNIVPTGADL